MEHFPELQSLVAAFVSVTFTRSGTLTRSAWFEPGTLHEATATSRTIGITTLTMPNPFR
jgi:hypothetical protein